MAGLVFGLLFGGAMLYFGRYEDAQINGAVLKVVGLISVLYPVIDIKEDLITHRAVRSDATLMADRYFGTPLMWGIIWGLLACIMAFTFIWMSIQNDRRH